MYVCIYVKRNSWDVRERDFALNDFVEFGFLTHD